MIFTPEEVAAALPFDVGRNLTDLIRRSARRWVFIPITIPDGNTHLVVQCDCNSRYRVTLPLLRITTIKKNVIWFGYGQCYNCNTRMWACQEVSLEIIRADVAIQTECWVGSDLLQDHGLSEAAKQLRDSLEPHFQIEMK